MGSTLTEKILAHASGLGEVAPGDVINARIDVAMTHDSLGILTVKSFEELPLKKVWDPDRIVVVFDHKVPATNTLVAESQATIRRFVKEQGIRNFYDVGRGGICHQVLHERGHVRPGDLVVGTDSHTTTHGALGALAAGIGSTEMAGVFATGELWFRVPETTQFILDGALNEAVMGKDVMLHIIGTLGVRCATYKAVEFSGPVIQGMSVAGRLSMCNMAAEMGAKNAIIEPDKRTMNYLRERVAGEVPRLERDADATYAEEHEVDCDGIEPLVAAPFSPGNVKPVSEVEGIEIDQAFIGSCTNGRMEDLRAAARILRGRRISDSVRLVVIPASQEIMARAAEEGLLETFLRAGASVNAPSCGPCAGADKGILGPKEVCVSTTNRNFVGRMGDPTSEVYLANPFTVAASAVSGMIADPRPLLQGGMN